jgi:hypothetical protein
MVLAVLILSVGIPVVSHLMPLLMIPLLAAALLLAGPRPRHHRLPAKQVTQITQAPLPVVTHPACNHAYAVPVSRLHELPGDEPLAWLCWRCGDQLPADFEPVVIGCRPPMPSQRQPCGTCQRKAAEGAEMARLATLDRLETEIRRRPPGAFMNPPPGQLITNGLGMKWVLGFEDGLWWHQRDGWWYRGQQANTTRYIGLPEHNELPGGGGGGGSGTTSSFTVNRCPSCAQEVGINDDGELYPHKRPSPGNRLPWVVCDGEEG